MRNNFIHLWGMPIVLAILTIIGLVLALVRTGVWHWVAWIALAVPIIVMGKYLYKAFAK